MPELRIGTRFVEVRRLTLTTTELGAVLGIRQSAARELITRRRLFKNVSLDSHPRTDVGEVLAYVEEQVAAGKLNSRALERLAELVATET